MVTAVVTVSLDHEGAEDLDHADRRALQHLPQVPDGARVVVLVGRREVLMHSAVAWLSRHAARLQIEVSASTPRAARRWYDAITSGAIE